MLNIKVKLYITFSGTQIKTQPKLSILKTIIPLGGKKAGIKWEGRENMLLKGKYFVSHVALFLSIFYYDYFMFESMLSRTHGMG